MNHHRSPATFDESRPATASVAVAQSFADGARRTWNVRGVTFMTARENAAPIACRESSKATDVTMGEGGAVATWRAGKPRGTVVSPAPLAPVGAIVNRHARSL